MDLAVELLAAGARLALISARASRSCRHTAMASSGMVGNNSRHAASKDLSRFVEGLGDAVPVLAGVKAGIEAARPFPLFYVLGAKRTTLD